MAKLARILFLFTIFLTIPFSAQAKVRISIDLSSQTMDVQASNGASYSWRISSARAGYVTPRGTFSANSLQAVHYSKKYHNSPMPHSIFFHGGFAIHGTYETRSLGRPASHGCVRISPTNAATLYSLVRAEGATITISGSPPPSRPFAEGSHHHHKHYAAHHGDRTSAMSYAPVHHHAASSVFGTIMLQQY